MLIAANIFQPLIDVFEAVLKFFHDSLGVPWGWAIVLLTVVIRALLIPLTLKQFHSMQRLQALSPQLKAIQQKYKEDKQRQQQEIMRFYKENQVNPLSSCLPLVAQLPVFISLFYMLRQSLRADICPGVQRAAQHIAASAPISHAHTVPCGPHNGASFLFISDLTNKATGATLVVLIVLYVGTQLGSSLLMSSPTMDQTQRRIMLLMPLFFVVFIISFPAGVIVYWITTNAWTILQQYIVKRRLGPVVPATAGGAPPGAGAAPAGAAALTPGGAGRGSGAAARGGGSNGADGGDGSGGGFGAMLRGRLKEASQGSSGSATKTAPAASTRTGPPPKSPRKKKKRSGRRR